LHSLPTPVSQLGAPLAGTPLDHIGSPTEAFAGLLVLVPAGICLFMCAWTVMRGSIPWEVPILFVTTLFSAVFVNPDYFNDVVGGLMRVCIGVVLMAMFCIPAFDRTLRGGRRWWLWICGTIWLFLAPTYMGLAIADVVSHHMH
jgi:hypothetical protein